ncbi:SRPBCC family protein [Dongia mobilis]|uniref:SRPBCC family protein n=1 Tax=Dongia sp. TaxID=1977262 RepID=UPI0026F08C5A
MRRYSYETHSHLPAEQLYRAFSDVAAWPQWDDGIDGVELDGPAETGSIFALKPRGRDAVKLRVETMVEPYRFADMAYLPLARLRTEHSFIPTPHGTLVRSTVEIRGPLARFWDRPLARSYAEGAARQTRSFLAFAATWNPPIANENSAQRETAALETRPLPNYVFC